MFTLAHFIVVILKCNMLITSLSMECSRRKFHDPCKEDIGFLVVVRLGDLSTVRFIYEGYY